MNYCEITIQRFFRIDWQCKQQTVYFVVEIFIAVFKNIKLFKWSNTLMYYLKSYVMYIAIEPV